jgi:gamma-glutamyltranspeptidase/glutathione hydrolase
MLRSGGTAADAAVAMAAALTVLEPTSNGIGSDAFALVWAEGELHGLNASGRAPFAASAAAAAAAGNVSVPVHGWDPVTVPGAPAAWHDLHARFGRLPFADVLAPSIAFAHEGHPVAPVVAAHWARAAKTHLAARGPEFAGWGPVFAPGGRAPAAGEVFRSPEHAATLRRLAETDVRDFYEGKTADAIAAFSRATGGRLTGDDLAAHVNDWVEPIGVSYRDAELWELPPNGQGIVALEALGILEGLPVPSSPLDEAGVHAAIEAVKLAFADALAWVTDLEHMAVDPGRFLEADYLDRRRAAIGERAERRETGFPRAGGTVYLAAADAGGMMVSYIQSNYMGFGSGIVVPGTGVALQNRGAGFSLDPGHPNVMAPGKRSYHTIIPAFLTRDGEPWGPLGVMGGHMQPQGHVQVMRAIVDHGLDPQAALDLPRWFFGEGLRVSFEDALPGTRAWPPETLGGLRDRGHDVDVVAEAGLFGRGQVILRSRSGVYAAGSDPRADGIALVY